MKKCRICGIEKPLTEFYYRKDSGHYRSECKECLKDIIRFRTTGWSPTDYEKLTTHKTVNVRYVAVC